MGEDIESQSLLDIIQEHCDLPCSDTSGELFFSDFYNAIKTDEHPDNFWNRSLGEAIKFFLEHFGINDNMVVLKIPADTGEHQITVGTLKESDAGYQFEPEEWVRPFYNINDKNYNEVRGHDQVTSTLNRINKLQFTHEQESNWIRLIMAQYGRRVEIEDLNRNFWVIAQVLAALGNYLMDDDSPIVKMFKFLLKELTELWENILFLWLEIAMTTQKDNDSIQVIAVPLSSREYRNDMRYDDFDDIITFSKSDGDDIISISTIYGLDYNTTPDATIKRKVFDYIKYLPEQYSEQNLCIIPYFRLNNYKHNYYGGEYYRYIFIYNQNKGDYLDINNWNIYWITADNKIIISPYYEKDHRFSGKIYGFKYIPEQEKYVYVYPFSGVEESSGFEEQMWIYGALRTRIEVAFKKSAKEITLERVEFKVYDAMREGISGADNYIGSYECEEFNPTILNRFTFSYNPNWERPSVGTLVPDNKNCDQIEKAAYLGECASWRLKSAEVEEEDLFVNQSYVLKIGSFLPQGQSAGFVTAHAQNENDAMITTMRGNVSWSSYYGGAEHKTSIITNGSMPVKYYKNKWESYTGKISGHNDIPGNVIGEADAHSGIPYSQVPEEQSCSYVTESNIKTDSKKAAKFFIKTAYELRNEADWKGIYQNPCYLTTAIGLTPWCREPLNCYDGRHWVEAYWDVGGICCLCLYVPSPNSIKEQFPASEGYNVDITQYETKYNSLSELALVESGGYEIGKIISCGIIHKYDTFCDDNIIIVTGGRSSIYLRNPDSWRQFEVLNTSTENICKARIINGGKTADNGRVIITADFNPTFIGQVNYYDVRYNISKGSGYLYIDKNKISTADVKITDTTYTQTAKGKIAACNGSDLANRTSTATDANNTGFPIPSQNQNFLDNISNGDGPTKFHGASNMTAIGDGNWYNSIYK